MKIPNLRFPAFHFLRKPFRLAAFAALTAAAAAATATAQSGTGGSPVLPQSASTPYGARASLPPSKAGESGMGGSPMRSQPEPAPKPSSSAAAASAAQNTGETPVPLSAEPIPGNIAPDFAFVDSEGKERRLSEFRGKPIVLDFWASWCAPCVKEFSTLRAIAEENAAKGLVVLSVSIDEQQKRATAAAAKHKITWAHGWMPGEWRSDGARKFKVAALPSVWFIGADGKILDTSLRGNEARAAARLLADGKLTVATDRIVKVSGLVVDEDGKPISGAQVGIDVGAVDTCAGADTFDEDWVFRTDANGVWTCPRIPKNAERIGVSIYHPAYLEVERNRGYSSASGTFRSLVNDAEKKAFYNGKHKVVLKRGVPIKGVVCDEAGKPIPNARVSRNGHFSMIPQNRIIATNEKGEFLLTGEEGSMDLVMVSADGFAPAWQRVLTLSGRTMPLQEREQNGAFLKFALKLGNTIRGTIVDASGNPIEGVTIGAELANLNNPPTSEHYRGKLRPTDKQGRFEIKDMGNPPFRLRFHKRGFTGLSDVRLRVGEENKIVLFGKTKIQVKIVDAETEKPVTDFRLRIHRESFSVEDDDKERLRIGNFSHDLFRKDMEKGTFQFHFTGSISKYHESEPTQEERNSGRPKPKADDVLGFEIFAPGFEPERVDFKMDGKTHESVVKLHKSNNLAFSVLLPDGKLAGEAQAEIAFSRAGADIPDGLEWFDSFAGEFGHYWGDVGFPPPFSKIILRDRRPSFFGEEGAKETKSARVAKDGKFFFPVDEQRVARIIITHPKGWGIFYSDKLAKGKPLQLRAWQTVQGTALKDGKKLQSRAVSYESRGFPSFASLYAMKNNYIFTAHPDFRSRAEYESEKYKIKDIPSGFASMGYSDGWRDNEHLVFIREGVENTVNFGTEGRAVKIKIAYPPLIQGHVKIRLAEPQGDTALLSLLTADGKKFYRNVRATVAKLGSTPSFEEIYAEDLKIWEVMEKNRWRSCQVSSRSASDGYSEVVFRDVLPGKYVLESDGPGVFSIPFEVPETPAAAAAPAIDLGTLDFRKEMDKVLQGGTLPDFTFVGMDGVKQRFSEFSKGRSVMLHFCETGNLPALEEWFPSDADLAVSRTQGGVSAVALLIHYDCGLEDARALVAKKKLKGMHAVLPPESAAALKAAFVYSEDSHNITETKPRRTYSSRWTWRISETGRILESPWTHHVKLMEYVKSREGK